MDIDGEEASVVDLSKPMARDHKKELDVSETITLPSCALCLKPHGKTCLVCRAEDAPVKVDHPVVESTSPPPVEFSQASEGASSQAVETSLRAGAPPADDKKAEGIPAALLFRCGRLTTRHVELC